MKRYFKIYASMIALSLVTYGCGEEAFNISNGGFLGANITAPSGQSFIKGATSKIEYKATLSTNAANPVTGVTAKMALTSGGKTSPSIEVPLTVSGNDVAFSMTMADLFSKFPVDGVVKSETTLNAGDKWVVSYFIKVTSGETLTPAGSTTITFTCASALAGTYNSTGVGISTDVCCPGSVSATGVVKLTANGAGKYDVSDFTGGLYLKWYGPDGGAYGIKKQEDSPAQITDVCDKITLLPTKEPFGGDVFADKASPVGTRNGETKVITFKWESSWGDKGTTTLTPQ